MSKRLGFSVRIFIPNGEPEGLRIIEKSNWTGQGFYFPRAIYPEIRGREDLRRTGVYVLWTPNGSGQLPGVYIGEGDVLRNRLDDHERSKDFWTHAVTFTSKDQNLNKAHIRYLEAQMYHLAKDAKKCYLENQKEPHPPSLSDADAADAELFLDDMLLCLPILGLNFFEMPPSQEQGHQNLILNGKNITARGYEDARGFVVLRDSQAVKDEVPSIHDYLSNIRKTLLSNDLLEDTGPCFRLTQDYVFGSPSTASGVLLGRPSSGLVDWKDRDGRTLKEIRAAAVDAP